MNTNLAIKVDSIRKISHRSSGHGQGGITRLMSPSGIGEMIKPFVFLDRFDIEPIREKDVNRFIAQTYHPHSGLMTVTTMLSGEVRYEDTTGASGTLPSGGIEYMVAGGGVWHSGAPVGRQQAQGFQLWVALPPELEHIKATSTYLSPEEIPQEGNVRVILGSYGSAKSKILPTLPMTYVHVHLKDGERWTYTPPEKHNVAWVAPHNGHLSANGFELGKEIVVFEDGNKPIEFVAQGVTDFVLGSAVKQPHPLVLGYYSVHTNEASLEAGEAEIKRIGDEMRWSR